MKKQCALVVSLLMSTVALAGCALVTPTPPAVGEAPGAAQPAAVAAVEAAFGPPSQAGFAAPSSTTGWRRTPIWNRRRWRAINSSWAICGSATAPMPGWARGSVSTRARPV